jgi:hypothetical protein
MSKNTWFAKVLIAVCVIMTVGELHAGEKENLIKNGSFSLKSDTDGAEHWRLSDWKTPFGKREWDGNTFQSAPGAIRFENDSQEQYTLMQQALSLQKDTKYRLSFWMKGDNLLRKEGAMGARIMLLKPDGGIFWDGSPAGVWKPGEGTFGWAKAEFEFVTGPFENLTLYLCLHKTTGTVWFDDISIEEAEGMAGDLSAELLPIDFHRQMAEYRRPVYHLAGEIPGMLMFRLKGDPKLHKTIWLNLELPEGIDLIGAGPRVAYRRTGERWHWDAEDLSSETITRDGKKYRRHIIRANKAIVANMRPDSVAWGMEQMVYVRTNPEVADKGGVAYWNLFSNAGQSAEQNFEIVRLPAPSFPAKPLESFDLMICNLYSQCSPFPEVRQAYRDYWKALHRRPITFDYFGFPFAEPSLRNAIQKDFGMLLFVGGSSSTPLLPVAGWVAKEKKNAPNFSFPPYQLQDGKEALRGTPVCPSYLIDDPQGSFWDRCIPELLSSRLAKIERPAGIVWDLEPGTEGCYCETCVKNFMQFAELAEKPSVADLQGRLRETWFKFRVEQHDKIVERFSRSVKRHFPLIPFWICTDPLHTGARTLSSWCGVDERLADAHVEGHLSMPYYSGTRFFDDVALNVSSLRRPEFPLVDPSEPLASFALQYTPDKIVQNMVASAALGCSGFGFWPSDNFDGRYLQAIATGASWISAGEPYYFGRRNDQLIDAVATPLSEQTLEDEGKTIRIVYPEQNLLKALTHEKDGNLLLTLINYNETQELLVTVKVPAVPDSGFSVFQAGSNTQYVNEAGQALSHEQLRDGFLCPVPANGVLLLEFLRDGSRATTNQIRQDLFTARLKQLRGQLVAATDFPRQKEGEAEVSWGDVDENGVPDLKLTLGKRGAYFAIADNAKLISWKNVGDPLSDLFFFKDRGFGDEIVLYSNHTGKKLPFILKSATINNGLPEAVFSYLMPERDGASPIDDPQGGLLMEKTVRLVDAGKTLHVMWRFTNNNPQKKAVPVGFRIKHYPRLGGRLAGNKPLTQISSIAIPTAGEPIRIAGGTAPNTIFLADPESISSFVKQISDSHVPTAPKAWRPGPVVVSAEADGNVERFSVEPDVSATNGLYIWWGGTFTIETLTPDLTLDAGETLTHEYQLRY